MIREEFYPYHPEVHRELVVKAMFDATTFIGTGNTNENQQKYIRSMINMIAETTEDLKALLTLRLLTGMLLELKADPEFVMKPDSMLTLAQDVRRMYYYGDSYAQIARKLDLSVDVVHMLSLPRSTETLT
jgi:hypothetical protein